MTYLKIILTIIAIALSLTACKLLVDNPLEVDLTKIGGCHIGYNGAIRVIVVER